MIIICYCYHKCFAHASPLRLFLSSSTSLSPVPRFSDVWLVSLPEKHGFTALIQFCIARDSLLRGMLGADLIGFQTHSYARHFRQTVSRILSVEATPKGIQLFSSTGIEAAKAPEVAHPGIAIKVRLQCFKSTLTRYLTGALIGS